MELQAISGGVGALDDVYSSQGVMPVAGISSVARATAASAASDSNTTVLSGVAEADLPRLTAILEPTHSVQTAALVQNLLQDTALAVTQRDSTRAIANLREIAAVDPPRVEILRLDPVLGPIRPEMERLLHQLTGAAKMEAEETLARAAQLVQSAGEKMLPNWQTRPEALMQVAHQLLETGGYANYLRSAELGRAIVDYSPWIVNYTTAPAWKAANEDVLAKRALQAAVEKSWTAVRKRAPFTLRTLWLRAPLLMLLLGWLGLGLVGGPASILLRSLWPETWPAALIDAFYELWAIGFLALVGFGFYARIRRIQF